MFFLCIKKFLFWKLGSVTHLWFNRPNFTVHSGNSRSLWGWRPRCGVLLPVPLPWPLTFRFAVKFAVDLKWRTSFSSFIPVSSANLNINHWHSGCCESGVIWCITIHGPRYTRLCVCLTKIIAEKSLLVGGQHLVDNFFYRIPCTVCNLRLPTHGVFSTPLFLRNISSHSCYKPYNRNWMPHNSEYYHCRCEVQLTTQVIAFRYKLFGYDSDELEERLPAFWWFLSTLQKYCDQCLRVIE